MYETSQIPSFFESEPKFSEEIVETPIKNSNYGNSIDSDQNLQKDCLYDHAFSDEMTEKQYEKFAKALRKAAAALPSKKKFKRVFIDIFFGLAEDHWELVRKKIKKPKKMKVTRSSIKCQICGLGLRTSEFYEFFENFYSENILSS